MLNPVSNAAVRSLYLKGSLTKPELEALDQHPKKPLALGTVNGRNYWTFLGAFYWEAEGLEADEVWEIVIADVVARAKAIVAQRPQDSIPQRGHISVDIRNFVFQRDGGKCVTCGSTVELQFDHIIPVKLGGSGGPENLQVLCGPCNRRKGATLG